MSTEKQSLDQPKGKTIFQKYSRWNKGQHMTTVLQTVPGEEKKVVIGRIYFDKVGEEKTYTAKSADGKEVLGVSKSYVDIEKRFAKHGHELALEELEKKQEISQEKTPELEPKPVPPPEKNPAEELKEIRNRGAKSKDRSQDITR